MGKVLPPTSVLISIRSKWCELIISKKKTIEIRKSRPALDVPFKVYIYCTVGNPTLNIPISDERLRADLLVNGMQCMNCPIGNGKIIGEFVCDQIEEIAVARRGGDGPLTARGGNEVWNGGMVEYMSCLSTDDICRYVGGIGRVGYGWHISDLKIYDQPKELSVFHRPCLNGLYCESCAVFQEHKQICGNSALQITRPPQSWCYVEGLE